MEPLSVRSCRAFYRVEVAVNVMALSTVPLWLTDVWAPAAADPKRPFSVSRSPTEFKR